MPEYRNRLLRVLTPDQLALLEPLERVELPTGKIVYRMEEPVTHFILPDRVVVSMIFRLGDGHGVEVMTSGATLIGGHTVFQVPESLHDILTRVGGIGWRVPRDRLLAAIEEDRDLFIRVRAMVRLMDRAMATSVACRSVHTVEQRFARLLLIVRDGLYSIRIPLSVPTIAEMLSVNRSYLGRMAQSWAGQTLIAQNRHWVELRDEAAIEAIACVCYREIAAERIRVLS